MNTKRIAGCEGKQRFTSFNRASKAASRVAHHKSTRTNVYACQCGGFHVGTKKK